MGESCAVGDVGDDGREEDAGGRKYAEGEVSQRSSYSLVMDLTERLCVRVDAVRLCGWSIEEDDSRVFALEPCALLGRLARRESERTRSPAIVFEEVVVLLGESERRESPLCVLADDEGISARRDGVKGRSEAERVICSVLCALSFDE